VSVIPLTSPTVSSVPVAIENLLDPPVPDGVCPRRARQQIDLILLAIEALDLKGSEAILSMAEELDLKGIIKNRVSLWRIRSTNPLRRYSQRSPLTLTQAKALVVIACHLTRRLTVMIRELLMVSHQLHEKQMPFDQHFRLSDYLERFRAHFRSRMNPRRMAVVAYTSDDKLNELALSLLEQLLFCTGTNGMQRLWTSLFDGEVE